MCGVNQALQEWMNVILESLLEEGGLDDDGAKGFRVSRRLQKLALAIATSRMTPSCCSATTRLKANGFMLGEGVHSSNIIPDPLLLLGYIHNKTLFTNASEILGEKEKRKKRQCRELVQRALVFHCYDAEEDSGKSKRAINCNHKEICKACNVDFFEQKKKSYAVECHQQHVNIKP